MLLLGVDVGGTFTDAVLLTPTALYSAKVPTHPTDQARSVMAAAAAVIGQAGVPAAAVSRFAHGMTVATNALLEGRCARTALVATEGFADVVALGRQARPSLYRLCAAPPAPLVPPQLRFEAPERMGPDGPIRPLDEDDGRELAAAIADARPEAIAVVLLHAYVDPAHERQLGRLLAEAMPGVHISLSHEVVGTFREYERAATTEVDAALSPLLGRYLRALTAQTRDAGLPAPAVMQSSGGLTDADHAAGHAALTVLSGPAGGAGGAVLLAQAAGEPDVLCFDMGGTSCDVCVIEDGEVRETGQRAVAGRPLALSMLDIHTVGAGGGSIAWRDPGGALRVGPRSAGADPGPASYGRGGREPTVTDANLVLGFLPAAGGLAGGVALDRDAAHAAVAALANSLGLDVARCAEGIVRVANAEMLRALRVVTVERGVDPRRFALMPFGGAGPLHACALARELSTTRILCPRASGVLSAFGLAAAPPRRDAARTVLRRGRWPDRAELRRDVQELLQRAADGLDGEPARTLVRYELRYAGQSFELGVTAPVGVAPATLRRAFARAHRERYGYADPDGEVELVTVRASAWGSAPSVLSAPRQARPDRAATEHEAPRRSQQTAVFDGRELTVEVWHGDPQPGLQLAGPAVWALPEATLLIAPGWSGEVDAHGTIVLRDRQGGA